MNIQLIQKMINLDEQLDQHNNKPEHWDDTTNIDDSIIIALFPDWNVQKKWRTYANI